MLNLSPHLKEFFGIPPSAEFFTKEHRNHGYVRQSHCQQVHG